jgi:uncharacterized protein (DUF433 family)
MPQFVSMNGNVSGLRQKYPDWKELQAEYPELEQEDIHQALAFAARNLDSQIIPMEAA